MAFNNFDTLVSTVLGYTENSDTEFLSALPNIITIAENRITRDLDTYGYVCHFTVSATPSDPFITKPTNTLYIKNLEYVDSSGGRHFLNKKTDEFLKLYWPDRTSAGNPEYYSEWDQETIIVAPPTSSGGIYEVAIVAQPTILTSAHVSNWHTNYAMNALFFATMVEAYSFMKKWDSIEMWEIRYQGEVAKIKKEILSNRFDEMDRPELTK